ncbi:uncharacterized protein LOC135391895 [Ornithodoros turicata]|uniref:uncharacterized protein LOC135391895 n=1 Tax=Ornithodoros turicata TaxID=34597 RepID=UPI003139C332
MDQGLLLQNNEDFWNGFNDAVVRRRDWHVQSFDHICIEDAFKNDVTLYEANARQRRDFEHRRHVAERMRHDPEAWSHFVVSASREVALNRSGPGTDFLKGAHLMPAFQDFIVHTQHFQVVLQCMQQKGHPVVIMGQHGCGVHDIDKLDPAMLVGYSERWEDMKDTSLWKACLLSHYATNVHHQQNPIWQHLPDLMVEDVTGASPATSDDPRLKAMPELLCDKVSRKLQKELGGRVSSTMWHLERKFFIGMQDYYYAYAERLAKALEKS